MFYLERIRAYLECWKSTFGDLKASFDFNAAHSAQLFNELAKWSTCLLCRETCYFDNVKRELNRDCVIFDVSCDVSDAHVDAVVNNSFQKVSISSIEDMEKYQNHGFVGEFILRICSNDTLQDCGCEAGEVVSILHEAEQKGFHVCCWLLNLSNLSTCILDFMTIILILPYLF